MLRTVLFVGFLFYSVSVLAFNVNISPVVLKLGSNQRVLSFTVTNKSDSKITIQSSAAKWYQNNGVESTFATEDIIITPPMFTVDPGAEQIMRIGLRNPVGDYNEKTYRIFLRELPIGLKKLTKNFLNVVFNLSLPLFVAPVKENKVVAWEIKEIAPDKLRLNLINKGNVHVAITNLVLKDANGPIYFSPKVLGSVLSGQSQKWDLTLKKILTNKRITIKATTDWEDKNRELNAVVPVN